MPSTVAWPRLLQVLGRGVLLVCATGAVTLRAQAPSSSPREDLASRVQRGAPFKIVLVGDSTVATGGGWGPGFCATLTPNVTCVDDALNGRSSRSFIDEGAWARALAEKGQYYFIQFGHNDQKPDAARHTDPGSSFDDNLRRYIHDVRAIGAVPILVSSLSRRTYKDGALADDGLKAYAEATRRVAAEEHVAFVDLFASSQALLRGMTQEGADAFDAESHPDAKAENAGPAKPDRTHLNDRGKAVFGRMVADSAVRTERELAPNVRIGPAGVSPAQARPAAPIGSR